jgi:Ca2+-binding RTX toxin-like protein
MAGTIDNLVPTTPVVERFGADTPPGNPTNYGYIGQTFKAMGDRLQSLDFLIDATGPTDTKYHLLITTVRTDVNGFHPDQVIKEIKGFTEAPDADMGLHQVHVKLDGLDLVEGQTYAFILDSFVARDGNADTAAMGVTATDTYPDGMLVPLRYVDDPADTRAIHFNSMWPVGNIAPDLAFKAVFSDKGNTIIGTRKGDTIDASRAPKGEPKASDFDDLIAGGKGNDKIAGGKGFDDLDGGKDKDKLYGGADGDRLLGGKGRDKLYGGNGEDCYLFDFKMSKQSAKKHFDKIYAFDSAEDAIYLKQGKFPALALGELPNTDTHVTYKNGALAYDGVRFAQFKSGVPASLDDIDIVIYA